MLPERTVRPPGFVEPCLPSKATKPPAGAWIHEIKYDGFRLMAWRDTAGVRLFTRRGHDWTKKFPLVAHAISALQCETCLIDGEVVSCDQAGLPVFRLLRQGKPAHLYAFDLLELNGENLTRHVIEARKAMLAQLAGADGPGLMLSREIEHPADVAFAHICALGFEGMVSKRRGSRYEPGRSPLWVKTLNPDAPSVRRLSEENWKP